MAMPGRSFGHRCGAVGLPSGSGTMKRRGLRTKSIRGFIRSGSGVSTRSVMATERQSATISPRSSFRCRWPCSFSMQTRRCLPQVPWSICADSFLSASPRFCAFPQTAPLRLSPRQDGRPKAIPASRSPPRPTSTMLPSSLGAIMCCSPPAACFCASTLSICS